MDTLHSWTPVHGTAQSIKRRSRAAVDFSREAPDIDNLILVLTSRCNLHCTYCYQTAQQPLSMEWETLRTAIDLAFSCCSHEVKVMFSGGEPLLEWPLIPKAVSYARTNLPSGKRLGFDISTNGLLVTDEIAEFFDRNEFEVQLSFDGVREAQNYRQMGSFAALDRLLDRLRQNAPNLFRRKLRVSAIQIPAMIPHFADSVDYLLQKNVRDIRVFPNLTPSPRWSVDDIEALENQFGRIYDCSMRHLGRTGEVPLSLFRKSRGDGSRSDDNWKCSAARGSALVVDADGQGYGCVLFAESYQEFPSPFLKSQLRPLRMGNLCSDGFRERRAAYPAAIARTEIFGDRRDRYSYWGRCADCPYLEDCRVCPVSIGYDPANTDPRRVPDVFCAFNRAALKYRALFPCAPDPLERLNIFLKR
jgi:sulfatase maturation enzyme AslB (radical SAM superfamily)